jgi:hypothetical protein
MQLFNNVSLSRKIIARKPTLQTTKKFCFFACFVQALLYCCIFKTKFFSNVIISLLVACNILTTARQGNVISITLKVY